MVYTQVPLTFNLGLSHTYLNTPFSENTGLIELKFHIEYSQDKAIVKGNLTKMAATSIYGKKICLNNKPRLTEILFNIIKEIL